jgi:hypothetical protein
MDTPHLSLEELLNNYEFKVSKRILMKEYPWVKDVKIREDEINKWNLIFVDLVVDVYEAAEKYGWEVAWYTDSKLKNNEVFWSPYLSTLFDKSEEPREVVEQMGETLQNIHNSSAIPSDIKLPEGRKLAIGSWIVEPSLNKPLE